MTQEQFEKSCDAHKFVVIDTDAIGAIQACNGTKEMTNILLMLNDGIIFADDVAIRLGGKNDRA